jgi:hypothetical protein
VTDRTTARKLTLLFSSAALMSLTACGGGGGGADVTAAAADPSAGAAAATVPAAPAPDGSAAAAAGATAVVGSQAGVAAPSVPEPVNLSGIVGMPSPPRTGAGGAIPAPSVATDAGLPAPAPVAIPAPAPAPVVAAPAPAPVVAAPAPAPAPAPVVAAPAPAPAPVASGGAPILGDCEMFPANAIFNTRIDDVVRFPAHPQSDQWVNIAGRHLPFGADWGFHENQADYGTYYGMPVNVIDGSYGSTSWPVLSFDLSTSGQSWEKGWPYKSDCAVSDGDGFRIQRDCTQVPATHQRFPFPYDQTIVNEDGQCNDPNACGDRHVLVVEKGACRLWESFFAYKLSGQWYALTTAAWNLRSNELRPKDWASADAAGLPMAPLLVKADEANSGEIRHALRVNFRDAAIAVQYQWPARHGAGGDNPGAMPFGALLRLKPDFVIPSHWTTQAKAIATAAKRYGMYVSDNGGDFHVQGEPSVKWDIQTSLQLKEITMNNMEFVDLKAITTDPRFSEDSMAASW